MTPAFREMETAIPPVGNRRIHAFDLQLYYTYKDTSKGCFAPQWRQGLDKFHHKYYVATTKSNVIRVHGQIFSGFRFTGTTVS